MTIAVQSMEIITRLVENMKDSFVEDKYFMSKDELLSIISDASRNKKLLVDIMCDTHAFNTCLAVFRESWKNRMSDIEIVTRCLEDATSELLEGGSIGSFCKHDCTSSKNIFCAGS